MIVRSPRSTLLWAALGIALMTAAKLAERLDLSQRERATADVVAIVGLAVAVLGVVSYAIPKLASKGPANNGSIAVAIATLVVSATVLMKLRALRDAQGGHVTPPQRALEIAVLMALLGLCIWIARNHRGGGGSASGGPDEE